MKNQLKVNILGTDYTLANESSEINPKMKDAAGLCEVYSKRIIIDTSPKNYEDTVENFDDFCHRALRHEGFHALFHEVGLTDYYEDETLVEMLAILYPRIKKIMDTLDSIDIDKI